MKAAKRLIGVLYPLRSLVEALKRDAMAKAQGMGGGGGEARAPGTLRHQNRTQNNRQ